MSFCIKETKIRRKESKAKAKMEIRGSLLVLFTAIVGLVAWNQRVGVSECVGRNCFPARFVFGTASSSYQVGGG